MLWLNAALIMALSAFAAAFAVPEPKQMADQFSPDQYLSYRIKKMPFTYQTISLNDQFLPWTEFTVIRPTALFNPAKTIYNGKVYPIANRILFYTAYELRAESIMATQKILRVANQFGEFVLTKLRPAHVIVATRANYRSLDSMARDSDHYLCYDIARLTMESAMGTAEDLLGRRNFSAQRASRFCHPVAVRFKGVESPIVHNASTNHLMCFFLQERLHSRLAFLTNLFGIQEIYTEFNDELCVPTQLLDV